MTWRYTLFIQLGVLPDEESHLMYFMFNVSLDTNAHKLDWDRVMMDLKSREKDKDLEVSSLKQSLAVAREEMERMREKLIHEKNQIESNSNILLQSQKSKVCSAFERCIILYIIKSRESHR